MKIINAKLIKNNEETIEEIKEQRDRYKYILEIIYKEVILKENDKCSKEENIAYIEYVMRDFIKEKEKK